MKKRLFLCICFLLVSCAPLMTYTPPKIEPVKKIEPYVLPTDPFSTSEPPKPIFLKQDSTGKWMECPKEEGILIAYMPREHDKIVLRLQYLKDNQQALVRLVNVYIEINNTRIDLQVDEKLAKELYKQLWMDTENKRIVDKRWDTVDKVGLWAIILGQLIAVGAIAF